MWTSWSPLQRAVTSSPGSSSAKPSTSKPDATLATVAGANAVALTMRSPSARHVIAAADRRDEVLAERALEIVLRVEAPVGARRRVVHVRRPRVDDALALRVGLVVDDRA